MFFNFQCILSCFTGYYPLDKKCLSCNYLCSACTSLTYCTSCKNRYYLNANKGVEGSECPSGTYPDSTTSICEKCPIECITCYGNKNGNCLICNFAEGFVKANEDMGECKKLECEDGMYKDINITEKRLSCLPCDKSCATCVGGTNKDCTKCKKGLIQKFLEKTNSTICESCNKGYYLGKDDKCQGKLFY